MLLDKGFVMASARSWAMHACCALICPAESWIYRLLAIHSPNKEVAEKWGQKKKKKKKKKVKKKRKEKKRKAKRQRKKKYKKSLKRSRYIKPSEVFSRRHLCATLGTLCQPSLPLLLKVAQS
jgi:hypothetical protein